MSRILVVDDEPGLRLLYSIELVEEGYQVVSAKSCGEAAAALKNQHIDLVILDIRLGRENGLEMLQHIVKHHKGIPVILCSAYDCYKDDFSSWLADSYVIKSSNLVELKNEIRRLLKIK